MITSEGSKDKYITIKSLDTGEGWKINARIISFAEFLQHMEPNEDDTNLFTVEIPAFLHVNEKIVSLIFTFYSLHNFSKEGIQIKKIRTSGWQNSLDATTLSFVKTYLQPEPEELWKRLLSVCEFLKLNQLKDAVCVFIASKHYYTYNNTKAQKEMEDRGIFYSRQMEINLKRSFLGYAQQFSRDILEMIEKRENDRQKQQEKN